MMMNRIRMQVESVRHAVKKEAVKMATRNGSIVSIALAGSWALGIPSPVDIDVVVVFKSISDSKKYNQLETRLLLGNRLDFHCYSLQMIENLMFKRKANINIIKRARLATRKLRNYPLIKQILISCLGGRVGYFKSHEISPQAAQILIPLVDNRHYLTTLQTKQKSKLEQELSKCELVLHQPDGFSLLLEEYLKGTFSSKDIKEVLINFYGDSKEFLQRAIYCYNSDNSQELIFLYRSIYGEPPLPVE